MPRRISPSQLRSKLRSLQQEKKRAVDRVNQSIRNYNRAVRDHNSRVRANQQRLRTELNRLNSRRVESTRLTVYIRSVQNLQQTYVRLDASVAGRDLPAVHNWLLDLSEREAANSVSLSNQLLGDESAGDGDALAGAELGNALAEISADLDLRWKGAVFSLNVANPDAARHFCTSSREIFTQILDVKAPDLDVTAQFPRGNRTQEGRPTRREKIKYLLHRRGITEAALEEFVEDDIENIVELFRVFNDGTHGSAGAFSFPQLMSMKKRVEDGLHYLVSIAG